MINFSTVLLLVVSGIGLGGVFCVYRLIMNWHKNHHGGTEIRIDQLPGDLRWQITEQQGNGGKFLWPFLWEGWLYLPSVWAEVGKPLSVLTRRKPSFSKLKKEAELFRFIGDLSPFPADPFPLVLLLNPISRDFGLEEKTIEEIEKFVEKLGILNLIAYLKTLPGRSVTFELDYSSREREEDRPLLIHRIELLKGFEGYTLEVSDKPVSGLETGMYFCPQIEEEERKTK